MKHLFRNRLVLIALVAMMAAASTSFAQTSVDDEGGGAHTTTQNDIDAMSFSQLASDASLTVDYPQVQIQNRIFSLTAICVQDTIVRPIADDQYYVVPRLVGKEALHGSKAPYTVYAPLTQKVKSTPRATKGFYAAGYLEQEVTVNFATSYLVNIRQNVSALESVKNGRAGQVLGTKLYTLPSCNSSI